MKTEDTEVLENRELKQARSKPDTVDRPVRTARTSVHHYNSTQYCDTETVFFQYSPSSRPTSHLRCGQVEVSAAEEASYDCAWSWALWFFLLKQTHLIMFISVLSNFVSCSTFIVSYPAKPVNIVSTPCRYPWKDGQAELARVLCTVRESRLLAAYQHKKQAIQCHSR